MFDIVEKVDALTLFPERQLFLDDTEENKILSEFELQKGRFRCAGGCTVKLALHIVRNVKEDLKILFKNAKNFSNIRKKIYKFVVHEVQPTINSLLKEEVITDIDDPRFNFYPNFSDDEEEEKKNDIEDKNNFSKKKWVDYELIEIIDIKENQTGLTFEKIFNKDRIGPNVTQILIEDPYLHTKEQLRVLYKFILAMRYTYDGFCQVKVRTKLNTGRSNIFEYFKQKYPNCTNSKLVEMEHDKVVENLTFVKDKCAKKEIDFQFDFVSHMHDRLILFNSGIMATPGRGLSIYHLPSYKSATKWDTLPCKGCRIQIFRLKGFDILKDDIYNISI